MINTIEKNSRFIFCLCCLLICYSVFLYFYFSGNWLYIAVPGLTPAFADFLFILAGSDCTSSGINVIAENPCDPWGRTHNYGPLWLKIGVFGFTREDTIWLAFVIDFIFLLIAVRLISPETFAQAVFTILFLISPAVMLGLERANADLIIFSLLAVGLFLLHSDKIMPAVLGCMMILIAAILKFYPCVILPVLFLYYSENKIKAGLLAMTLAFFLVYLSVNWNEISQIISVIPNITWHYSLGGELLFSRLGYQLNDTTRTLTWCMAFFTLILGIILGCRVRQPNPGGTVNRIAMLYLVGAVLVVFSFVVKNSFDYRNVYFLFLLPLLFLYSTQPTIQKKYRLLSQAIILVYGFLFWAEFFVSLFNRIESSAIFIRLAESALNWVILVPVTMLAMNVALDNGKKSPLMGSIVQPLEKRLRSNE